MVIKIVQQPVIEKQEEKEEHLDLQEALETIGFFVRFIRWIKKLW